MCWTLKISELPWNYHRPNCTSRRVSIIY